MIDKFSFCLSSRWLQEEGPARLSGRPHKAGGIFLTCHKYLLICLLDAEPNGAADEGKMGSNQRALLVTVPGKPVRCVSGRAEVHVCDISTKNREQ